MFTHRHKNNEEKRDSAKEWNYVVSAASAKQIKVNKIQEKKHSSVRIDLE